MILLLSHDTTMISQIANAFDANEASIRVVAQLPQAEDILATEPGLGAAIIDLDATGPGGFALCRMAHKGRSHALSIVIVGSRLTGPERYESFASGASDLMSKPLDPRELALRLRAHRAAPPPLAPVLRLGEMRIDLGCGEVLFGNRRRTLTPHEAAILRHLAARIGRCVPTEELLVEALGYPPKLGNPEIVRTHIRHLRQKLEPDPTRPCWLVNVPRVGYQITLGKQNGAAGVQA